MQMDPFHEVEYEPLGELGPRVHHEWWHSLSAPEIREFISRRLDSSWLGVSLDIAQVMGTLTFSGLYIAISYLNTPIPTSLRLLEIVCAFLLLLDYIIRGLLLSESRFRYLLSASSLLELSTIIPVIPLSFFLSQSTLWGNGSLFGLLYPLRFIKVYTHSIRAISSGRWAWFTPLRIQVAKVYLLVVVSLLVASGVLLVTGYPTADEKFLDYVFEMSQVIAFVGYTGDPSVSSKLFIIFFILLIGIFIPIQLADVLQILSSSSPYTTNQLPSSFSTGRYIVLFGVQDYSILSDFLIEFFHFDHYEFNLKVVVFSTSDPSEQVKVLLLDPFYSTRVYYMRGSPLDVDDLVRAGLEGSKAVFLATNMRAYGRESSLEDAQLIVTIMAIRKFFPEIDVLALPNLKESAQHIIRLGVPESQIICADTIRLGALVTGILTPGSIALVYQIVHSFNISAEQALPAQFAAKDRYRNFIHGCEFEIYPVTIPYAFHGLSFPQLSVYLYDHFDGELVLFAVGLGKEVLLFPPGDSFVFSGGESAFVFSRSAVEAKEVSNFTAGNSSFLDRLRAKPRSSLPISPLVSPLPKGSVSFISEYSGSQHLLLLPCHGAAVGLNDVISTSTWKMDVVQLLKSFARSGPQLGSRDIVLLSPFHDDAFVTRLSNAVGSQNLYIVAGNPTRMKHLEAVKAESAWRILVTNPTVELDYVDPLVDAETLIVAENLRALGRSDFVVSELLHQSNILLVGSKAERLGTTARIPLSSISGASALDSPNIISPAFMSGNIFLMGLVDTAFSHMFYNPYFVGVLRELLQVRSAVLQIDDPVPKSECRCSYLTTRALPETHAHRNTYGDVFRECVGSSKPSAFVEYSDLSKSSMPIGLYRRDHVTGVQYSFFMPPMGTVLLPSDRLILLLPKDMTD